MIAMFALSLSLVAGTLSQETTAAPVPAASDYEADLGCFAVFTIAQGVLRRGDGRQDQIAAVMPALRSRIDGYIADGVRDEAQFAVEFQEITNARRGTFAVELPACLERAAAQP